MYNFGELKTNTGVLVKRSGDSDYLDKTGVWLNIAQSLLYNSYDYFLELKDVHNFSSVADQEAYIMPNRFGIPLRVYDITNNKEIHPNTEEEYFDANIANIADAETGTPEKYR